MTIYCRLNQQLSSLIFVTFLSNLFVKVEQLLDEKHKVVGVELTDSPPSGFSQADVASLTTPVLEGAPSSTNPSPMDTAPG